MLVVCEATGGYERHVLAICLELGVAVHKAHGSRVRYFARYLGLLAKTDPIDARVLALYGLKTTDLRLYVPPAPEALALTKRLENPARPAPADALRRIKPAGACPPLKRQPKP